MRRRMLSEEEAWEDRKGERWWCRMVSYPPPVLDMPPSNASCSFFSGRVLDDLPVISYIINICLLVKVGWRPYHHAHDAQE